jgi:tRNA A37 threonylcarbamoyladenosine dehydratase
MSQEIEYVAIMCDVSSKADSMRGSRHNDRRCISHKTHICCWLPRCLVKSNPCQIRIIHDLETHRHDKLTNKIRNSYRNQGNVTQC